MLASGRGFLLQAPGRDGGGDSRADWRRRQTQPRSNAQLTEDEISNRAFLFPAFPASGAAETSEPAQAKAQEPAADTGDVDFKSVTL